MDFEPNLVSTIPVGDVNASRGLCHVDVGDTGVRDGDAGSDTDRVPSIHVLSGGFGAGGSVVAPEVGT